MEAASGYKVAIWSLYAHDDKPPDLFDLIPGEKPELDQESQQSTSLHLC